MAYGRGSAELALAAADNPQGCVDALCEDGAAQTSKGPFNSRKNLWEQLGRKMGLEDPFRLEPQLIYAITGALKKAGYRSGQQYLDTAKAVHVANGNDWTEQLAQARRFAIRSLKRGLGNPKPLLKISCGLSYWFLYHHHLIIVSSSSHHRLILLPSSSSLLPPPSSLLPPPSSLLPPPPPSSLLPPPSSLRPSHGSVSKAAQ